MIRNARAEDLSSVLKIYQEAKNFIASYNSPQWQDHGPDENSFCRDLNNNALFVNEQEEGISAVMSLYFSEPTYNKVYGGAWPKNSTPYAVIHRIAIASSSHHQGLATQFFDYVKTIKPIKSIRIDTHEMNIPMRNLLIKSGFIFVGVIFLSYEKDNQRLAYCLKIK